MYLYIVMANYVNGEGLVPGARASATNKVNKDAGFEAKGWMHSSASGMFFCNCFAVHN